MDLNEMDRWQECLQRFGGVPVGTSVDSIPVEVLDQFRKYLEPQNSRVFLLPYYGLDLSIFKDETIILNGEVIDSAFITDSVREKFNLDLDDDPGNIFQHYLAAMEVINLMLLNTQKDFPAKHLRNFHTVRMHMFDDFLLYSETEFGMWEMWFHKSGDCSVVHAPKEMDFDKWVDERANSFIGISGLDVPNTIFEIEGVNLLSKFAW